MEKLLVIELCAITKLASLNSKPWLKLNNLEMARLQNIEWAAYEAAHPCAKKQTTHMLVVQAFLDKYRVGA